MVESIECRRNFSSKFYFLKQLKRSGVEADDLLYFYVMAIRPVLEYACPVWH